MFIKFLIGVIVALGILLTWGQLQIWTLKFENQVLITKVQSLSIELSTSLSNEETANTILAFRENQIQESDLRIDKLQGELVVSRKNVDYVRKLFNGHNFAKLLAGKPGMIEKRMIAATAKVLKELEDVTKCVRC